MAQSFTIRNKSTRPIMTIGPKLLAQMLEARPDSVSLALAKHAKDYQQLTGKPISVTYEQEAILLKHYQADENGSWKSKYTMHPLFNVIYAFRLGFMARDLGSIENDIILAEQFFDLIDLHDVNQELSA